MKKKEKKLKKKNLNIIRIHTALGRRLTRTSSVPCSTKVGKSSDELREILDAEIRRKLGNITKYISKISKLLDLVIPARI